MSLSVVTTRLQGLLFSGPVILLIACLHRRHGQDKTVLSCPCRRCEQAVSLPCTSQFHSHKTVRKTKQVIEAVKVAFIF